jgi:hypothetical protein
VDGSDFFAVCAGKIVEGVAQIMTTNAAIPKTLSPPDLN